MVLSTEACAWRSSDYLTEHRGEREREGKRERWGYVFERRGYKKKKVSAKKENCFSPPMCGTAKVGVPPVALYKIGVNKLHRLKTMFSGNEGHHVSCDAVGAAVVGNT